MTGDLHQDLCDEAEHATEERDSYRLEVGRLRKQLRDATKALDEANATAEARGRLIDRLETELHNRGLEVSQLLENLRIAGIEVPW